MIILDFAAYAWFTAAFGILQATRKRNVIQTLLATFLPLTVYFGSPWFAKLLLPSGHISDILIFLFSTIGNSTAIVWGVGLGAIIATVIYKFVPHLRWILEVLKWIGQAMAWFVILVLIMTSFASAVGDTSDMFQLMRSISPVALPYGAIQDDIFHQSNHYWPNAWNGEYDFEKIAVFHLLFFSVLGFAFWQWAQYRFRRTCGRIDDAKREKNRLYQPEV